jgi:hypothetical protein
LPAKNPDREPPRRLTVQLLPKVSEQLAALCERTGYSKTDAVNRALLMYRWADDLVRDDKELIFRDPETGECVTLVFTS